MVVSKTHQLMQLLDCLTPDDTWTVFICPCIEEAQRLKISLGVLLPNGARFSGRTTYVGSRKVSVITGSDPLFIPSGVPYNVSYVGYGIKMMVEAEEWHLGAKEILSPAI